MRLSLHQLGRTPFWRPKIPKINDLTNRPGGPQPTDEIWLASAGGVADFKTNFDAITELIVGNLSSAQLNKLFALRPFYRVTNAGSITASPGSPAVSCQRSSPNIYTISFDTPGEYIFNTATATAFDQGDNGRIARVMQRGASLVIETYSFAGTGSFTAFYVSAELERL